MTGEAPTLEQRVTALEEALAYPRITLNGPRELPPEDIERLSAGFEKAVRQPPRIIQPPPGLSPDEVRHLLRECVTVVKPGEVLVLRGADGMTPEHVGAIQEAVSWWLEGNAPGIKAIVVPPMEIAIVPAGAVVP